MAKNTISLKGRAYKAEPNGDFIVGRSQLKGEDLRALPPGTRIVVNDSRGHRNDSTLIINISGPGPSGFDILFDYWQCPHCWGHAIDYSTFMEAAMELLKGTSGAGITYHDTVQSENGIHHILYTSRTEHTIEDMETTLEAKVESVLDQLIQFTIQLDQQVKHQFHV